MNKIIFYNIVILVACMALLSTLTSCDRGTIVNDLSFHQDSRISVSCVNGDTSTPHVANCSASPKDWVALANGFACNFSYVNADSIAYFSWICLDAGHTWTYPEIESELKKGQRFRPSDDGIAVCSNLRPNTKYSLFAMAVSIDDVKGELIKVDFSTPHIDDVRAPISEIWVDGGHFNWAVKPFPACHGFFMMASEVPGVADEEDVLKAFWLKKAVDLGTQRQYFQEGEFKLQRNGEQLAVWTRGHDGNGFSSVIENRASRTSTTRSASEGGIVLTKGKHLSPDHYHLYVIN